MDYCVDPRKQTKWHKKKGMKCYLGWANVLIGEANKRMQKHHQQRNVSAIPKATVPYPLFQAHPL